MNRRITFAAAVAVVSCALFAQELVTVDLSKMAGSPVAMVAKPLTNELVLSYWATNTYTLVTNSLCQSVLSSVLSVDGVVKQLREQGDMTNLVKTLVKSGDVCAVVGHQWANIPYFTLEYRPDGGIMHRTCGLCGKVETKEPGEWK
jgi:hypothetical protein